MWWRQLHCSVFLPQPTRRLLVHPELAPPLAPLSVSGPAHGFFLLKAFFFSLYCLFGGWLVYKGVLISQNVCSLLSFGRFHLNGGVWPETVGPEGQDSWPLNHIFIYPKLVTSPDRPVSHSTHLSWSLAFVAKRAGLKQTFKCLTRRHYRSTAKSIKKTKKNEYFTSKRKF